MSDAISGIGAKFKRGDGESVEVFTALAEVKSIVGPNMTKATIDVTNLDSTSGYREFIGGFRDGGEVTLEMNFTRDNYILLLTDFQTDNASRNYQIVFPDEGETTLDFAGVLTAMSSNIPTDDAVSMPVTIKVDGPVTPSS